ncbi:hypothetical protein ACQPZU_16500 [Saccharomonospora azurea]|uniref:hypothetical protein n=1 Tax=Saccharomonospora azurea TaxID=40988 RepID=UPI003D8B7B2E
MSTPDDKVRAVSDPTSPDYDPDSSYYDVTADSSSRFYVGPVGDEALSGDDIRSAATVLAQLFSPVPGNEQVQDAIVQATYSATLKSFRDGLGDGLDLRPKDEPPNTLWDNASHEYMVEVLNTNADSAAIAETSEEWVRFGNELSLHQKAVAEAIEDSMGDWAGEGGDAAREHLAEVARWLGRTAQGSVLTGRQQQIHSQTLNETQKQMAANPPVDFSVEAAHANLLRTVDPVSYGMYLPVVAAKAEEQRAAREQAARLMKQFDATIGEATDMPYFTPPPKLGGGGGGGASPGGGEQPLSPLTMMSRGLPGKTVGSAENTVENTAEHAAEHEVALGAPRVGPDGSPVSAYEPHAPYGAGGSGGVGVPGGQAYPGAGQQGQYVPPPVQVPDLPSGGAAPGGQSFAPGDVPPLPQYEVPDYSGTSPSTFTAPSTYTPPELSPGSNRVPGMSVPPVPNFPNDPASQRFGPPAAFPPGAPGTVPPLDSGAPRPKMPGIGGGVGGGAGGGAAGLPGGVGGGAAGGGAAGGGAAGGGAASGGSAAGQNSAALRGPGGAADAAMRAAQQGPGARGAAMPMAGGMPPAGGARQQEGDNEHRVAGYLTDEDGLFNPEEVVAPPVIGDWSNKDWK